MKKYNLMVLILFFLSLTLGCTNNKQNTITWYEKEIIRSIEKINSDEYKVEIGISAQIFHFDIRSENAQSVFANLNYSLKNWKYIKIGI